ncbi:MAG: glycosyltransferase family 2 protein [Candidatus Hydrothermarchaeales archaeon]
MAKDILVGIPAINEEATIIHVLNTVAEGLSDNFPEYKSIIFVADGGSTDRTVRLAESFRDRFNIKKVVERSKGIGKGEAVLRIMKMARAMKASMVAIIDSDLLSIQPSWVDFLLRPLAFGMADFTTPRYIRDKHDGGITKHLSYPMITALFGKEIRQPMGGEFGMSLGLVKKCLKNPFFPKDFGIDTFMTSVALANNYRIHDVPLGPKFHESTQKYLAPENHLLPMFEQVCTALFNMMKYYESNWRSRVITVGRTRPRRINRYKGALPTPTKVDPECFYKAAVMRIDEYEEAMKETFGKSGSDTVKSMVESKTMPSEFWIESIFRCAAHYKKTMSPDTVKVLAGLWLTRYANFVEETKNMNLYGTEVLVYDQMLSFLNKRDYLLSIY